MKKNIFIIAALIAVAGCKMYPKRTVPKPPPAPFPTGFKPTGIGGSFVPPKSKVSYIPTDFALTSVRVQQNNAVLTWQNGTPPFQVQIRTNITGAWANYGPSTMQRSITNPAPFKHAFFRVTRAANSGEFQWVRTGNVPASADVRAVATESNGNVVIVGTFGISVDFGNGRMHSFGGSGSDGYVVKYDSAGNILWSKHLGNFNPDEIRDVAIDTQGNVIITGGFVGTVDFGGGPLTSVSVQNSGFFDMFVVKYSASGAFVWAKNFGPGTTGHAIAVDRQGDLYAATQLGGTANFGGINLTCTPGGFNFVLLKMKGANGVAVWATVRGGTGYVLLSDLALDAAGDIAVCGSFYGTANVGSVLNSAGDIDVFVAKYSGEDGTHRWARQIGAASSDTGSGVTCDTNNGNVVITGKYIGAANFGGPITDFSGSANNVGGVFIAAYNNAGNYLWAHTPNISAGGYLNDDNGRAVAIDSTGNIFWTGIVQAAVYFSGPNILVGSGGTYFSASLTGTGTVRWAHRAGGAASVGTTITVDGLGHAYTAGTIAHGLVYFDYLLESSGGSASTAIGTTAPFVLQYVK